DGADVVDVGGVERVGVIPDECARLHELRVRSRHHVAFEVVAQPEPIGAPRSSRKSDDDRVRGEVKNGTVAVRSSMMDVIYDDEVGRGKPIYPTRKRLNRADLNRELSVRPRVIGHDGPRTHIEAVQLADRLIDQLFAVRDDDYAFPLAGS